MPRSRLLFVAILLLQCAAHSQKTTPPGATKINYVARIPASVMKYRPKSAVTRFYGLTEIQGQRLALHFYDLEPIQKLDAYTARRNSRLDIFAVSHRRQATIYKRMHSITLTRRAWTGREKKIVCEMFHCWLDPANKTKSIIMARISNPDSGFYHSDSLLTFSNGLQNTPSANYFGGDFTDVGWSGWRTDYTRELDKNGFLMPWIIDTNESITTFIVYKWDGHIFKEIARQADESQDSVIYHWNGEKFVEEDLSKRPKPAAPAEK